MKRFDVLIRSIYYFLIFVPEQNKKAQAFFHFLYFCGVTTTIDLTVFVCEN